MILDSFLLSLYYPSITNYPVTNSQIITDVKFKNFMSPISPSITEFPAEIRKRIYDFLPNNQTKLALILALKVNRQGSKDASFLLSDFFGQETFIQDSYERTRKIRFKNPIKYVYRRFLNPTTEQKRLINLVKRTVLLTSFEFRQHIQSLYLSLSAITSDDLNNLYKYSHLKRLSLRQCEQLQKDWTHLLPPTLTYLDASSTEMTTQDVKNLPETLLNLAYRGAFLEDTGIENLPRGLKSLHLRNNVLITGQGLKELPPSLTVLRLPANANLTDNCLNELPSSLTKLFLSIYSTLTPKAANYCSPNLQVMVPNFLPNTSRIKKIEEEN